MTRPALSLVRPLIAGAVALLATASALAGLRDEVEILIDRTELSGATVAVSVRDADSGAELVAVAGETLMIPASNMKLLTTGAALHMLGPDFEFRTALRLDGDRLAVIGDGDPGFGDPVLLELMHLDIEAFLGLWVSAVVDAGVTELRELVVDDRVFDRSYVHPAWPADQLNRRYCAEVAGLNFHANVLNFYPRPGQGHRPDLELYRPHAPWLNITNRATTRQGLNDRNDVWIARQRDTNALTFYGNVKFPYRMPAPVTVHNPPEFFVRLLADRLTRAGVEVERTAIVGPGEPVPDGHMLAPIISTPITTAVTRCNRDSQNLYAESLLKRAAHLRTNEPGDWPQGAAVLRHVVHERVGNPALSMHLVVSDGSGLSRENRVAASLMTAWLNTFHDDKVLGEIFVSSLARAGESGTLEKRFQDVDLSDTTVSAKSGYIRSVSCLSGYVTAPDGRRRSFSILVNDLHKPGDVARAKRLQEQIVGQIAWDLVSSMSALGGGD